MMEDSVMQKQAALILAIVLAMTAAPPAFAHWGGGVRVGIGIGFPAYCGPSSSLHPSISHHHPPPRPAPRRLTPPLPPPPPPPRGRPSPLPPSIPRPPSPRPRRPPPPHHPTRTNPQPKEPTSKLLPLR